MMSQSQAARHVRMRVASQLFDESSVAPRGTAIYSLSDPRDVREIRYIGQTTAPRRRLLQHLSTARLWLPDEVPWWVPSPRLRPLYEWIRALHRDEGRLPVMVVSAWVETSREARLAERNRIYECLERRFALLNSETEVLGRQIPLL